MHMDHIHTCRKWSETIRPVMNSINSTTLNTVEIEFHRRLLTCLRFFSFFVSLSTVDSVHARVLVCLFINWSRWYISSFIFKNALQSVALWLLCSCACKCPNWSTKNIGIFKLDFDLAFLATRNAIPSNRAGVLGVGFFSTKAERRSCGNRICVHLACRTDLLKVHMADMNTLTAREGFVLNRIVWINKYFHQ